MAEQPKTFTPQELRNRDWRQVWDEIFANEPLMQQAYEGLAYFDAGNPGITWEEMVAKARARRDQPAV